MLLSAEITANLSETPAEQEQVSVDNLPGAALTETEDVDRSDRVQEHVRADDGPQELSVVQHEQAAAHTASMFYGSSRPKRKARCLNVHKDMETVVKKRRVICRPSRFND